MGYGAEIWEWKEMDGVERMQERYMRWVLGLGKGTPGYLVREELKRDKLRTRAAKRAWNFEEKLRRGEGSSIARICLSEIERRETKKGVSKWEEKRRRFREERGLFGLMERKGEGGCGRVYVWSDRDHGEVNYYLTQMLSGHGCFRAYLHKHKHEGSPLCPTCTAVHEDAEHVFFICPRFTELQNTWESTLGRQVLPENLMEILLSSQAAWDATSNLAAEVMKELRNEEPKRKPLA
ncbi:uncharacterized protein LOC107039044 [Diachasma alloeum]|uniref:uncharacterized protein LOC107039044 n=1 Tax=Diachasma alloeum TaxID=454923 RepID=UPI0007382C1E|nr:uncharacterized protein LOC107039044 [Diachasma alloeum]